ncbi:MAG: gliding motility-associated C-terminal domain-containing protein [Saprospiraceae bacterium]|nr:gliding motility-associated C-terminal domain-containing protein [Saprospiraceae bacterium]
MRSANKHIRALLCLLLAGIGGGELRAQLDSVHWIPPMHARANNTSIQVLYLSTPEAEPFQVTVSYRTYGPGAAYIDSVLTIANNAPAELVLGNSSHTAILVPNHMLNTPLSGYGIIVRGAKKFYANLRVQQLDQATSLTAKGRNSLGTQFRVGHLINSAGNNQSNFIGILAVEDNTQVSISGYAPGIEVQHNGATANNTITPAEEIIFTLNAGESYVLSVYCHVNVMPNFNGLIGALIASDKPVAVSCGSWWALHPNAGQDMGIDQITPVEHVGTEYVLVRGAAAFTNESRFLETPVIIAHYDNTEVRINGSSIIQFYLNAGEYLTVPNSFYVNQQNMYIQTTAPVFVYQSLAGGASPNNAELNFVPPISCEIGSRVDNIPKINFILNSSYSGSFFLIATADCDPEIATTGIAGTLQGPFPVMGNATFVTYKGIGYTGNVQINATCPLQFAILGRSENRGWGGYFSGFREYLLPDIEIAEPIPCQDTLYLQGTNANSIRWYKDGVLIAPAPENSYALPISANGVYTAVGQLYQDCLPEFLDTSTVVVDYWVDIELDVRQDGCRCDTPGAIAVSATGAYPAYEYRLNGGVWQSDSVFEGLSAGTYLVEVRAGHDVCLFAKEAVVEPNLPHVFAASICPDSFLMINGTRYDADRLSGTECFAGSTGCDSIVVVELNLYPHTGGPTIIHRFVCDGSALPGTDTLRLQTLIGGCDSTVIIITALGEPVLTEQTVTICSGEQYAFFGEALTEGGIYTHTFSRIGGCDSMVRLSLSVTELTLDLGVDVLLNLGESVRLQPRLSGGVAESWMWSDGSILSCTGCWTPEVRPVQNTILGLRVWDADGCEARDELRFTVQRQARIFVPNAFSPNGDGINDVLAVYVGPEVRQVRLLQVYDRWGGMLYSATGLPPNQPSSGWDGHARGRPAPAGVYVWRIAVELLDGTLEERSGEATLMR